MGEGKWHDLGPVEPLRSSSLRHLTIGRTRIALSWVDGDFAAISGACNHVGGPLGEGKLEGEYVVCPWHNWKFHRRTGEGEPGFEDDRVPAYDTKIVDGHLWVNLEPRSRRHKKPHPPHPLERVIERGKPGGPAFDDPLRVVGISTTNMDLANPRYSSSDHLLDEALARARDRGAETRHIRLAELSFRACEGYYSKSAHACTWPCSITQMDPGDQMDRVYEAFVQWGDVFVIATPIRWGQASSLYYKMVERMNCVQNQETLANRVLLRSKVVGLIVTGGQDNIQAVVGQMLTFFGELGCQFPPHPFIAHSRGWTAEDMEQNVRVVQQSRELHEGARALVDRCMDTCQALLGLHIGGERFHPGGRKAHRLE